MLEFEMPNDAAAKWAITVTGNRYAVEGNDNNNEWIPGAGSGQELVLGLYIGNAGLEPTFSFSTQATFARATAITRSGGSYTAVGEVQRAPKAGASQSLYVVYDDYNLNTGGPGYTIGVYSVGMEPRSPVISAKVVGSRVYFA
jgi:hypothetical protein